MKLILFIKKALIKNEYESKNYPPYDRVRSYKKKKGIVTFNPIYDENATDQKEVGAVEKLDSFFGEPFSIHNFQSSNATTSSKLQT